MSKSEKAAYKAIQRRSIGCTFSHLWSDALFARERARECVEREKTLSAQVVNAGKESSPVSSTMIGRYRAELSQKVWDRGSYVRWAVISAYMAFERACCDATDDPDVSRNLPTNLCKVLVKKGVSTFDWKVSPWKEVDQVREKRVKYVHRNCTTTDLLADISVAENSVIHLREGAQQVYSLCGKNYPLWLESDEVPIPLGRSSAWATVLSAGATEDPKAFDIKAVHGGVEWDCRKLRSDEDPWPYVEELASNVQVPLSEIRIYQGGNLWKDIHVPMRGFL